MNRARASAALLLVVALSGCSSTGVDSVTDDSDFAACAAAAGLSLDGAGDWSAEAQRTFLADPAALDCVVTTLDPDQRRDVLAEAYPEVDGNDDGDLAVRFAPTDALVAYAGAQIGQRDEEEVLSRVVDLMASLWWQDPEDSYPAREQVALTLVRATDGLPGYDAYLAEQDLEDDYTGRAMFAQRLLEGSDPAGDQVREITADLGDALDTKG